MEALGKKAYRLYVGVGAAGIGLLAVFVFFSVVMRYFFSITYMWMEELIKVVFAFTTFWGLGACVLTNENIVIDLVYTRWSGMPRKIAAILSDIIVLCVNLLMLITSIQWTIKSGDYMSKGLLIPYYYIYSIVPIGFAICIFCTAIVLCRNIKRPASEYQKG